MSSALSIDLRQRVVHAVEAGASRHQAAKRFGVSLASASRWCGQFARWGRFPAKPMGGDQRSHRIKAHADLTISLYEARPGIYLRELQTILAEHGVCVTTALVAINVAKRRGGLALRDGLRVREQLTVEECRQPGRESSNRQGAGRSRVPGLGEQPRSPAG